MNNVGTVAIALMMGLVMLAGCASDLRAESNDQNPECRTSTATGAGSRTTGVADQQQRTPYSTGYSSQVIEFDWFGKPERLSNVWINATWSHQLPTNERIELRLIRDEMLDDEYNQNPLRIVGASPLSWQLSNEDLQRVEGDRWLIILLLPERQELPNDYYVGVFGEEIKVNFEVTQAIERCNV